MRREGGCSDVDNTGMYQRRQKGGLFLGRVFSPLLLSAGMRMSVNAIFPCLGRLEQMLSNPGYGLCISGKGGPTDDQKQFQHQRRMGYGVR